MGKAIRLGAVLCWLGAACGCGDSPNMTLRDALNARNELVDALLKVNDDESAKTASATEVKKIQKRWDDGIRKRVEDLQRNLDTAERAVTRNRKNKALLAGNDGPIPRLKREELPRIPPDLLDRAESLVISDEAMEARQDEIKATAKRMVEQIARLSKLIDQLHWKEINDQKARGIQNPTVVDAERWPNLTEILKAPQGMCAPKEIVEEKMYTWQAPLVVGELPPNLIMLPKR